MKIIFEGPELQLETLGQGPIVQGKEREIDPKYGYDLVVSGRVRLVDEPSRLEYRAIRLQRIEDAVKAGGTIYCDGCQHEIAAKDFVENGCPRCPAVEEEKEN